MIATSLQQKIGQAMKDGDGVRLSVYRMLLSELNYEKIKLQHELDNNEELQVIRREAKKRKEAIEAYKNAGSLDRAENEEKELLVLQEFLPAEIADADLETIVRDTIKELEVQDISKMGQVIAKVKEKTSGNVDGSKLAQLVRTILS